MFVLRAASCFFRVPSSTYNGKKRNAILKVFNKLSDILQKLLEVSRLYKFLSVFPET